LSWRFRPFRLILTIWSLLIIVPISQMVLGAFFDIEIFRYLEYRQFYCIAPFFAALLLGYIPPIMWLRKTDQFWIPQMVKAHFLVLLYLGILFVVTLALALHTPEGPFHLATAEMDDHVYYLGYTKSYPGFFIQLFKCDRIGLFCTRVCEDRISSTVHKNRFGLHTYAQTHIVSLTLDDKPICSHFDH
jgi:hypothetical protein